MAACIGGALAGGGSLFSGLLGSQAATKAAQIQAQAATNAANLQYGEFEQTQGNLQPYFEAGTGAINTLAALTGSATGQVAGSPLGSPISTTFAPTTAQLEQTPGYQFSLAQGEKATQNSLTASGLARSGPAAVAQDVYAQGVAGTTFQQQFGNWLAQQNLTLADRQQIYNMLSGISTTGEAAAAGAATSGVQATANIGQALQAAGTAQAGGVIGSTNALTGGLSSASSIPLLLSLQNAGMYSGTGGGFTAAQASDTAQNILNQA